MTPMPYRRASAATRAAPTKLAESCARKSPFVSRGARTFASRKSSTLSSTAPPCATRVGGRMMPSWNSSRFSPRLAGEDPPTST